MKTLTVTIDDALAAEVECLRQKAGYASTGDMIRVALRNMLIEGRKRALEKNLRRYLQDKQALAEATDAVESRLPLTAEALERVE
ncbi:MAG: ribbon-helix-helix protein, CopG family [Chloroflexi bacterium]|nr:ribbon-helix-helix protein, CopG family [Chloroflexota bacterium]